MEYTTINTEEYLKLKLGTLTIPSEIVKALALSIVPSMNETIPTLNTLRKYNPSPLPVSIFKTPGYIKNKNIIEVNKYNEFVDLATLDEYQLSGRILWE